MLEREKKEKERHLSVNEGGGSCPVAKESKNKELSDLNKKDCAATEWSETEMKS